MIQSIKHIIQGSSTFVASLYAKQIIYIITTKVYMYLLKYTILNCVVDTLTNIHFNW